MFEEHAIPILQKMGLSGNIPAAIKPQDIEKALSSYKKTHKNLDDDQLQDKDSVPETTRASPLISLLEKAQVKDCEVMWR